MAVLGAADELALPKLSRLRSDCALTVLGVDDVFILLGGGLFGMCAGLTAEKVGGEEIPKATAAGAWAGAGAAACAPEVDGSRDCGRMFAKSA